MPADRLPQVPNIVRHLREHDCLPFPAGPLVPRECTQDPAPAHRSTGQAANLAAALLAHEITSKEGAANPKTRLTTLMSHSAIAWATRHSDLQDPSIATGQPHPAKAMLQALYELRANPAHRHLRHDVEVEFFKRFQLRLRLRPPPKNKPNAEPKDALVNVAYTAPAYRCTCFDPDAGQPLPKPQPPSLGYEAVAQLLDHPGAEWWLLARVFLVLLHSHLGWITPGRGNATKQESQALHRPAAQLLTRRAMALAGGSGPDDGPVAAGVAAGLAWPFPQSARSLRKQLPAPVADTLPDEPEAVLSKALGLQPEGTGWHGFAVTHLPAVARLARDVAADLTTPALAPHSGQLRRDHDYMAERHTTRHKQLTRWAREVSASKGTSTPTQHLGTILRASFVRSALLPRIALMQSYSGWMGKGGGLLFITTQTPVQKTVQAHTHAGTA